MLRIAHSVAIDPTRRGLGGPQTELDSSPKGHSQNSQAKNHWDHLISLCSHEFKQHKRFAYQTVRRLTGFLGRNSQSSNVRIGYVHPQNWLNPLLVAVRIPPSGGALFA